MICPNCGHDNLPGSELCGRCTQDLTQLDRPIAQDRVERSLMHDPVRILKPGQPITVTTTTSIRSAIDMMLAMDRSALLVVDQTGKLIGIFSERDLLTRVAGNERDLSDLQVETFMTPNPETVNANDTLAFAVHKMDVGGYRHLPVVQGGMPTGVISARDLLRHITRVCNEG